MIHEIGICEYLKCHSENDVTVDLRDKTLYKFGTLPGAINIPVENIRELYRLPKDKDIYVFCQAGEISGEMAQLLSDAGYNAFNLTGGYREYLRCFLNDSAGQANEEQNQ